MSDKLHETPAVYPPPAALQHGAHIAGPEAYAALAIGCTLGLAVFKRATELGWY